jgi:hypothetical protein
MKFLKIFFFTFICAFWFSCISKTEFIIKNSTNSLIDSIKISNGYDYVFINGVKIKETVKCNLKFSDLTPNYDGLFYIEIFPSSRKYKFGYYTNGLQPDYQYYIEIKKDTILVNEKKNIS